MDSMNSGHLGGVLPRRRSAASRSASSSQSVSSAGQFRNNKHIKQVQDSQLRIEKALKDIKQDHDVQLRIERTLAEIKQDLAGLRARLDAAGRRVQIRGADVEGVPESCEEGAGDESEAARAAESCEEGVPESCEESPEDLAGLAARLDTAGRRVQVRGGADVEGVPESCEGAGGADVEGVPESCEGAGGEFEEGLQVLANKTLSHETVKRNASRNLRHSATAASFVPESLPADWPMSIAPRDYIDSCVDLRSSAGSAVSRRTPTTPETGNVRERRFSFAIGALHSGPWLPHNAPKLERFIPKWNRFIPKADRFIINPNSLGYIFYAWISLLVFCHDLLVVPYVVAWEVEIEGPFLVLAMLSCIFWTIDIFINFITAYAHSGRMEFGLSRIACRYVRTWFLPDLIMAASDMLGIVLLFAVGDSVAHLKIVRFAKVGRLLRLIGLLRTIKVVRSTAEVVTRGVPDSVRTYSQCFLTMCCVVIINHVLSCAWFGIGRAAPSDTGRRWTDVTSWEENGTSVAFLDSGRLFQYVTSFHWSVAQLTLGAVDVVAYNTAERIFSVTCLTMGLIFGTTFISTVSAGLVENQMAKKDQRQKLRALRKYLRENSITQETRVLVEQQAWERIREQPRLKEEDVLVLQLLSADLRRTLRKECFRDHLRSLGIFTCLEEFDSRIVQELCMAAMASVVLQSGDELFVPSSNVVDKAYRMISGQAVYMQEQSTAPVREPKQIDIKQHKWVSEAALWVQWMHVGTVKAKSSGHFVSISASSFAQVLEQHPTVAGISLAYSKTFHKRVTEAHPPNLPWPTDLEVPWTDYKDVVAGLSHDTQITIGMSALDRAYDSGEVKRKQYDLLTQELVDHQCVLLTGANGQLERIVSLVALKMLQHIGSGDDTSSFLVELGELDDPLASIARVPHAKAAAQLPGKTISDGGEDYKLPLAQVLERFSLDPADVQVLKIEHEEERAKSRRYGVQTCYNKMVIHVKPRREPILQEMVADGRRSRISTHSSDLEELAKADAENSRQEVNATATSVQILSDLRYFKVSTNNKAKLCTWLSPEAFQRLTTSQGEKELHAHLLPLELTLAKRHEEPTPDLAAPYEPVQSLAIDDDDDNDDNDDEDDEACGATDDDACGVVNDARGIIKRESL